MPIKDIEIFVTVTSSSLSVNNTLFLGSGVLISLHAEWVGIEPNENFDNAIYITLGDLNAKIILGNPAGNLAVLPPKSEYDWTNPYAGQIENCASSMGSGTIPGPNLGLGVFAGGLVMANLVEGFSGTLDVPQAIKATARALLFS